MSVLKTDLKNVLERVMNEPLGIYIGPQVKCCGYLIEDDDCPVYWNKYNEVIQCHACGAIYKHESRGEDDSKD